MKPEKVIGTRITEILGDKDGKLSAELTKLFGTEDMMENFELHYQSEKLGKRIFNITARGIIVAEEEELIVIEDITEKKLMEIELRENKEKYEMFFENSLDIIQEKSLSDKVTEKL